MGVFACVDATRSQARRATLLVSRMGRVSITMLLRVLYWFRGAHFAPSRSASQEDAGRVFSPVAGALQGAKSGIKYAVFERALQKGHLAVESAIRRSTKEQRTAKGET